MGKHDDVAKSSMLSGFGPDVLAILNTLAQEALRHNAWQWGRPVIPQEEIQREAEDEVCCNTTATTNFVLLKTRNSLVTASDSHL
jgi:hypothetical protein